MTIEIFSLMGVFFKSFFGALLALVIFSLIIFFILLGMVNGLVEKDEEEIGSKSVLTIDLSKTFPEHKAIRSSATGFPASFVLCEKFQWRF